MPLRLVQRRTVWVPTWFGFLLLALAAALPAVLWCWFGESFLAETSRVPADVLIVEAWTKEDGARAALTEFSRPGAQYRYIVAAGGLTGERWYRTRWHEVEVVRQELLRDGFPERFFIGAETPDVASRRTFATAIVAQAALASRGIHPRGINVITCGAHARRSRLTFAKVFGSGVPVGVIAWIPPGYVPRQWWQTSDRAVEFLKESVGYVYEALLNSGRFLHSHASAAPGDPMLARQ